MEREKIIAYHNEQVANVRTTMEKWNTPEVVESVEKSEWERIQKGMKADIENMIDYTNKFLNKHNLPTL